MKTLVLGLMFGVVLGTLAGYLYGFQPEESLTERLMEVYDDGCEPIIVQQAENVTPEMVTSVRQQLVALGYTGIEVATHNGAGVAYAVKCA